MTPKEKFKKLKFGTVKVGERGQVVIPAELREEIGIKPGDKLVVLSKHGKAIMLIRAEQVEKMLDHISSKIENFKGKIS